MLRNLFLWLVDLWSHHLIILNLTAFEGENQYGYTFEKQPHAYILTTNHCLSNVGKIIVSFLIKIFANSGSSE